ncbi:nitroreductase family protein [Phototrophicus methaneseepsis]|uniref:Nitroreductase family protein n=1 Tax=Phototrophicus methaneseepsis TaxID=2710758 RepID=A0A7S8E5Y6_9CHLR|nr:nitroreductase family protein [Phototrophicus methaneseepsis]QPC81003.1 nitroreductase family protein [Phototrophicus methaneseepsis]
MNVKQAIRTKRAVRQYTDDAVPDEIIREILDTARWSQSSKNTQPWEFVIVTDPDKLRELAEAGNFTTHVPDAAFVIVLVSDDDHFWRGFDLGQVAMCLQLAAWEKGIGSCPIAFQRPEQAKAVLQVPSGKAVHAGITFGYPSTGFKPAKMGGRESVDAQTHWNTW